MNLFPSSPRPAPISSRPARSPIRRRRSTSALKSNPFEDAIAPARDRLGRLGSTIVYYPTIGSTNDAAADLARARPEDAEGAVVVADEQTAGRGRRGHTWFSPPGSGLYVSTVLMPGRAQVDP